MNNLKKIISLVLAVVLVAMTFPVVAFAAEKGDVDGDGNVGAKDARLVLQFVAGIVKETDLKDAAAADVDSKNGITATDARRILQIVAGIETPEEPKPEEPKPDVPAVDSQKAELAALFNAETAKAVKGEYKWTRTSEFTKDIDVGNATATLNSIIKSVDENADLNSVVGSFLGVGDASGTHADAGKYALVAMKLTKDDIKKIDRWDSQEITFTLNNSNNPSKDGNTPFNHVSNDFITRSDVEEEIAKVNASLTINEFNAGYNDVVLSAKLDKGGNPTSLTISYKLKANMSFKMTVTIKGSGEVATEIVYTDFKY